MDEPATQDVEYRGLLARTWDFLRGDTSDWADRPFYLEAIGRFGEPVLDVACGTGRLLLDYLGQGIDIDGVDVSDDMLELCRAKAPDFGLQPRLYRQGMESLDLPRRYRSIIVPSSSFQLLLDPAAAREAMGRFFVHLEPGGALVMPFIVFGAADEAGVEFVREKVRPDGSLIRKHASYRYDPATQFESTDELVRGGGRRGGRREPAIDPVTGDPRLRDGAGDRAVRGGRVPDRQTRRRLHRPSIRAG